MKQVYKTNFLDPEKILAAIPLKPGSTVADFGCGNGHYAVAAATAVGSSGAVWALDVMEDALSQTASLARSMNLRNITTRACDLEKLGSSRVADTSCDLVIIGSLIHQTTDPAAILQEAYRVLKTGGVILVVEWKPESRIGPTPDQRISRADITKLFESKGFRPVRELEAGDFHYAVLYAK